MGIAHQSSDPLLINLYVSKDARHWSSIHDGMTIKRLSQVSHGCPADVHVSNMCHSFKRSFSNYVTCYKRMIYTYIYIYICSELLLRTIHGDSYHSYCMYFYVMWFQKETETHHEFSTRAERRTNHKESPFSAFMWECAPLTAQTAERRWCRACRGWLGVVFGSKSCWIIRLIHL